jgi:hypothetical protein
VSAVYVGTKWSRRAEAQAVMAQLRAMGHTITHDWTHEDEMAGATSAVRDAHFRGCALADACGVAEAEVFLLLHDPAARGAYVELGMAIALGVRVMVVGGAAPGKDPALDCPIFYWLAEVEHYVDVESALGRLAR